MRHSFSAVTSPACARRAESSSSLEKRPACRLPSATVMAPVSVARFTMNFGLKRSLVYQSASARTNRPSASVLMISMVWPDMEVTISPGRWALPSGMFSTRPMTPITFALALRAASTCIRPVTAAAPPMSPFISSILRPGFSEMPPVSKTTPLPTKAIGSSFLLPPFHCITASRGGRAEPCATPRSAFMPSFFSSFSPRTSTSTPSLRSSSAFSANSTGPRAFGGRLTRSRARVTPPATASDTAKAFSAS
ncbi:hypothetical protein D3C72_1290630 [compost metagenome]